MVTHQLRVERRTAKERWPETDVLPLCKSKQENMRLIWSRIELFTHIYAVSKIAGFDDLFHQGAWTKFVQFCCKTSELGTLMNIISTFNFVCFFMSFFFIKL